MDFCQNCTVGFNSPEAYERLLLEVIRGDRTLFTRWDEVEEAWRFVEPIITSWKDGRAPARFPNYAAGEFVLVRTRDSYVEGFDPGFVCLTSDAAEYLASVPVRGVGIDTLGIERDQPGHPSHTAFFRSGVLVLEGLRLADVPPGRYFLIIALLNVIGVDAAPARVFLLEGFSNDQRLYY